MTSKEKAVHILECALAGADDNLCRSRRMFDPAQVDMSAEYGNSGRTRQEFLDAAEKKYQDVFGAVAWAQSK